MSPKVRGSDKALGCSLFRPSGEEPLALVSGILKRSGVKVGKVSKETNRITGRIGSLLDPYSCKVTAKIFNQREVSLVELECQGGWGRPGERVLSTYMKLLCRNFDDAGPADVERAIDWKSGNSNGRGAHRSRTEAVTLIKKIEAEIK
jgi:hypothetical protein